MTPKTIFKTLFFLMSLTILFSCSKDDGPNAKPDKVQLILTASATEVGTGEEITFEVTAGGKAVSGAEIFIDDNAISGSIHVFEEAGTYQIMAKKEGFKDSEAVSLVVHEVQIDVYVAGGENNMAKYWKNGQTVNLTDGINIAVAHSIVVSNGDVYVAGREIQGAVFVAKYWKNGVPTILSDGSYNAIPRDIVVSNGDVHIVGYELSASGNTIVKYWKNGVAENLTDGTNNAVALDVFLKEGDIYVAGYEYSGTKSIAKYWKNGTAVNLTDGTNDAGGYSITISEGDIYVAGFESNGTKYVAKYWKNGNPVNLSEGTNDAFSNNIAILNGDIYVTGRESDGTHLVAKYWKNGTPHNLSDGTVDTYATGLFVSGNNVYISGYERETGIHYQAKYWHLTSDGTGNVTPVILAEDNDELYAMSIFVTKTMVE